MYIMSSHLSSSEAQGQLVGDDKIFVVNVSYKIETSPLALTLTEPVPEAFELPASDWPEKFFKFFWLISDEEQPGDSGVFFNDVVFLINRHS